MKNATLFELDFFNDSFANDVILVLLEAVLGAKMASHFDAQSCGHSMFRSILLHAWSPIFTQIEQTFVEISFWKAKAGLGSYPRLYEVTSSVF